MRIAHSLRAARGFSLLELVVVLVMISIMSAVILPEMRGTYDDELLRSTSRRLISAMNLAYSQSVAMHDPHRLRLDPEAGRYHVERVNHDPEAGGEFLPIKGVPGGEGALDPRIRCEVRPTVKAIEETESAESLGPVEPEPTAEDAPDEGRRFIAFHPDGTADDREIVLRDRGGFGLVLRVNPITARVRIVALEREVP